MRNPANIIFLFIAIVFYTACNNHNANTHPKLALDAKMIDSIRQHSDSIYEKPYKRSDWVTAEYFVSKKDSTITQIMKDSFGVVRQIIIEKGKRRVYVTQFYTNGQQQYKVKLDAYGQFDGDAEEYNLNGSLKRTGIYKSGLHIGPWKNYDENGVYSFTQQYNENGQEVEKFKE